MPLLPFANAAPDLTPMEIGEPVTGGTANSVLFIDASGNLAEDNPGITYIPGTGLSLDDNLRIASDSSVIDLGGTTGDYTIGWDGSDAVHTITAGDFVFTGGNVGIGTTEPGSALHVSGTGADIALSSGDTNVVGILSATDRGTSRQALYFNHDGSASLNDVYIGSAFEVVDGVNAQAPTYEHAGSAVVNSNFLQIGHSGLAYKYAAAGAVGDAYTPTTGFVIDTNGNVGIGTTEPTATLDVDGASNLVALDVLGTASGGLALNVSIGSTDTAKKIAEFSDSSGPKVTFKAGGNVGIGTTAPGAKLHTRGDFYITHPSGLGDKDWIRMALNTEVSAGGSYGSSNRILFKNLSQTGTIKYGSILHFGGIVTDNTPFLMFSADTAMTRPIDGTMPTGSHMVIDINGNVGIGTTSPDSKLNIVGSNYPVIRGTRTTSATNLVGAALDFLIKTTGDMAAGFGGGVTSSVQDDTAGPYYLAGFYGIRENTDTTGSFAIMTRDGASFTEKARIKSNGKFGLGTTNPQEPFHLVTSDSNIIVKFEGTDASTDLVAGVPTGINIYNVNTDVNTGTGIDFSGKNTNSAEHRYARISAKNTVKTAGAESGELAFLTRNAGSWAERVKIDSAGKVGIGEATPTSVLHLKAGTAAANTAPLKFTSGTLLGTPEAGTIEYNSNKIYITNKCVQRAIDRTSDVAVSTVTVANTTDETTLWTGSIDANCLVAGNMFMFHADGIVSNNSSNATDEVTVRVKVGGVTKVTLSPDTKQLTDTMWHIDANATQRTLGETGERAIHIHMVIGDPITTGDETYSIGITSVDTTENMDVTITAEWASADANNTISLYQGFMRYKN